MKQIKLKNMLTNLGYKVDECGNIETTNNQMGLISLENTYDGGILRIHSDSTSFFYKGDEIMETIPLSFPTKMTSKFVYFEGEEQIRVTKKEFTENVMLALSEYIQNNKTIAG